MDRRVYYLTFFVFSVMVVLLPTLTRQAVGEAGGEHVLGASCNGVDGPRSDIDCDGNVKLSDFSMWLEDYRARLVTPPLI